MSKMTNRRKSVLAANDNVYVFVDLSSFIFQRYFAIKAWTKMSNVIITNDEAGRKLIKEKYDKTFREKFIGLQKKFKMSWKNVYVAKDCPRDMVWRRELFPDYKKHRDDRVLDFDPSIFVQTYEDILPELQATYPFKVLGYKGAEADDIVAVLKNKVRREKPEAEIVLLTNDNDYLQLLDDRTQVLNSSYKPIKSRFTSEVLDVFVQYKVIKGDTSDNIPPIDTKIGDKTAVKLATNPELLGQKLAKSPKALKQFELNRTLIDFDRIPRDMRLGIENLMIEV